MTYTEYPKVVEYQPGRWVKVTSESGGWCQDHFHDSEPGAWDCTVPQRVQHDPDQTQKESS